jgi:hypothetical protein
MPSDQTLRVYIQNIWSGKILAHGIVAGLIEMQLSGGLKIFPTEVA